MGEWKEYKLGDIAEFKTGKLNSNAAIENGKYPFFTCSPETLNINDYAFDSEALLLAGNNAEGVFSLKYYKGKFNAYQRTYVITIPENRNADYKFLFYNLQTQLKELQNISFGSATKFLTLTILNEIKIKLPDLSEQKSIASVLSSLDDKIDLLHRQNKTLEALAETLFRQWFIEAAPQPSPNLSQGERNKEKAEKGWETRTIEDEFDFTMGQSPPGSSYNEDGNGMVFFQGRTDFGFRFPEPRVYTTEPNRLAKQFDTLISVRAPVGDINMAMEECCLGRGVAAFRYKKNPSYYTYTYYKLGSLMAQIKQFEDSGTVFGSVGKDDFRKLGNIIPSDKAVDNFQAEANPLDEKIYKNTLQIKTLTRLRDTLLPKLMSGEVRVKTK